MTYPKDRTKFVVAGVSPHLSLVRDYFIRQGWALIPWSDAEAADIAIIGADLNLEYPHPPVAQIEMQLMNVVDSAVVLSSPLLTVPNPQIDDWGDKARATWLYAKTAEHMFTSVRRAPSLAVRPVNVYGPTTNNEIVSNAISEAKIGSPVLWSPGRLTLKNTFIREEDFLDALHFLIISGRYGRVDISGGEMTYQNVLRSIWKFINGSETEPRVMSSEHEYFEFLANVNELDVMGWKPKYSVRSGLFELCNTTTKTSTTQS